MDLMSARSRREPPRWRIVPPFRPSGPGWIADLPPELDALTDVNEEPYRCRLSCTKRDCCWARLMPCTRTSRNPATGPDRFGAISAFPPPMDPIPTRMAGATRPGCWQLAAGEPEYPVGLRRRVFSVARSWAWATEELRWLSWRKACRGVEIAWVIDERPEPGLEEVPMLFGRGAKPTARLSDALADPRLRYRLRDAARLSSSRRRRSGFQCRKACVSREPVATTAEDASAIMAAWQRSGRVFNWATCCARHRSTRRSGSSCAKGPGPRPHRRPDRATRCPSRRILHAALAPSVGALGWLDGAQGMPRSRYRLLAARCPSELGCKLRGQGTFAQPAPARFCSVCDRSDSCPYVDNALHERRSAAEMNDPTAFGLDRCVFDPEKDIVDHQVVSFELDNGTRGTFTLAMQGPIRSAASYLADR